MSMSARLSTRSSTFAILLSAVSVSAVACGGPAEATSDEASQTNLTPVASDATTPTPVGTSAMAPTAGPTMPPPVSGGDPNGAILGNPEDDMIVPPDLTTDTACAGLEVIPEEVEVQVPMEITTTTEVVQPVAFYIVLDNSLSMEEPLPGFENENGGNVGGRDDDDTPADTPMDPAPTPQLQQVGATDAGAAEPAPVDPAPVDDADAPTTRWELAVSSLQEFVSSPGSAGIDVAIQYFNPPGQQGGGGDDLCDGSFHGTPDVEMGPLPDNVGALVDSLEQASPNGYTPTVGALTGGIQYCQQFQIDHPEEKCLVVLVTDGLPRTCGLCEETGATIDCYDPMSDDILLPIAAAGNAAGVRTFTVVMDGVPADGFVLMDAIAASGGTDCTPPDVGAEACNVSSTGSQGLVEALTSIRESVTVTETVVETTTVIETKTLECQWIIPEPPDGDDLDPERVNVQLSLDGVEGFIDSVPTEADCAANNGIGWYYDNAAAPTMIYACPESCAAIQTGVNPSVQILLGCATMSAGSR
jgi:hypothetical protein